MIVVDTNVIGYFFLRGEENGAVLRLRAADSEWVAPKLWLDEFVNMLCTQERVKLLKEEETAQILVDALTLMGGASYTIAPAQILNVARRTGCSGYDSQYIALAEKLNVPLYTFDKKILKSCPDIAFRPE